MQAEQALEQTSFTPLINRLAAFEPNGYPFLSIYLDARTNQHGRDQFGIWLKKELAERTREAGEEESVERQIFQRVSEYVLAAIEDIAPNANGLAIFASVDSLERDQPGSFFEVAQFGSAIEENELVVSDRPYIFPMARLIAQNPRYVCAWADTNAANIYVFGGELAVNAETPLGAQVEEIQNVKTQRQQQGGWSQQRFQRRLENFHQQHAKELAETLDKLVRDDRIEMVVLSGDAARIIQLLRDEMSKELSEKVIDEMNLNQYASEKELYEASHEVVQKYERKLDAEKISQLSDEVGAKNLGVVGVTETLAALSNGQVNELFILSDTDKIRYNEQKVEQVLEDYAPGDDNSANDALPDTGERRQVLDELIVRAINSSARIRFIEDPTLLMNVGGVGALLRYKIEENPETAPQA
jgi:peptide subunit release factor 1 (eRF1)